MDGWSSAKLSLSCGSVSVDAKCCVGRVNVARVMLLLMQKMVFAWVGYILHQKLTFCFELLVCL